jgi:protein-S-isoprenylcysteine O-methyltransferase Ste14
MSQVLTMRAGSRYGWSDWVGFLFYMLFALAIVATSPEMGILLLPAFLHEFLTGVSFLVRRPLQRRLQGWGPRLAAYSGSFLMPLFVQFALRVRPDWVAGSAGAAVNNLGIALWLIGSLLSVWTVWRLRHSFSLEPQARALVTSGPYRLARHPIYLSYVLLYGGIWLMHATVALGLMLALWFVAVLARIHYEESVLDATFAEYAQYRRRVAMFGPRAFRSMRAQVEDGSNRGIEGHRVGARL